MIATWLDSTQWKLAQELVAQGRVRSTLKDGKASGFVQLATGMPFPVSAAIDEQGRGLCNLCRDGGRCAHVGALLLHAWRREGRKEETPLAAKIESPVPSLQLGNWKVALLDGTRTTLEGAMVRFRYGGHPIEASSKENPMLRPDGDAWVAWERQLEEEARLVERLRVCGLRPIMESAVYGVASNEEALWIRFLEEEVPRLREEGWEVVIEGRFRIALARIDHWWGELTPHGPADYLLGLGITIDGQRYDLVPILQDLLRTHSEDILKRWSELGAPFPIRLPDGRSVCLPPDRIRRILSTLASLLDPSSKTKPLLTRAQAATLGDLEVPPEHWRGARDLRELAVRLEEFKGIQAADSPPGLQAELRPYQSQGLGWLQFLRNLGFGGILADDMGLGKTLQSIAHILTEHRAGRLVQPALVLCPTSLVSNWFREIRRFAPDLRVMAHHGPLRNRKPDAFKGSQVVVTTYPLLQRDQELIGSVDWHMAFFDEAHQLKNPKAQAVLAVKALRVRHRVALTGTPMENHLGELWCLMDLLNPGLLGTEKRFRDGVRNPIEKRGDRNRLEALSRRIAPFLLRRTKFLVAKELPPKTEIVRTVSLEGGQRDLYESVRSAMDKRLLEEIDAKGMEHSSILVLDALLKLRQVCCDPHLVKQPEAKSIEESAKLELLLEMLPELVEEGRKVLIFSQFTSMLAIIERCLRDLGLGYALLTGDTKDRQAQVDLFQSGQVPLFLLSLKAGGAGLNLTAADTVIIYDPWWNPAAEEQAIDRAYRIGQDKPVFVYRLIAEGTVEERVVSLQDRKRNLSKGLLEGGGTDALSLTAEDLRHLLSPMNSAQSERMRL